MAATGAPLWSLIYVYFGCPGAIGRLHQAELEAFGRGVDSVPGFRGMSYQQLLQALREASQSVAGEYWRYLGERYALGGE